MCSMALLKSSKGSPEDREAMQAMVKLRAIASEHFEAGVIIMSREIDGFTSYHTTRIGNHFAVRGLMEHYMEQASLRANSNE